MKTNKGYNGVRKINLQKGDKKWRSNENINWFLLKQSVNIITILIDFPFLQDYNVDIKKDLFYSWEKVMTMYFW